MNLDYLDFDFSEDAALSLTLTGTPAFCEAFRQAFGPGRPGGGGQARARIVHCQHGMRSSR